MPEAAGFYFDIFCFFPCSSISIFLYFLCCVYWDLGSLGYKCMFIYASFFTLYLPLFFFCFYFILFFVFILEVSLSCSFVTAMVLWIMSALICCWLGKKKLSVSILYQNTITYSLRLRFSFFNHHFLRKLIILSCCGFPCFAHFWTM